MGDRFDEVRRARASDEALARELKFAVTDMNGWQTAYGYDDGAFRGRGSSPRRRRSGDDLGAAPNSSPTRASSALLSELQQQFDRFMALDVVAWRALQAGDRSGRKRILLGPELRALRGHGGDAAEQLAAYEAQRRPRPQTGLRRRARRRPASG